jgi:hypothetical protein
MNLMVDKGEISVKIVVLSSCKLPTAVVSKSLGWVYQRI